MKTFDEAFKEVNSNIETLKPNLDPLMEQTFENELFTTMVTKITEKEQFEARFHRNNQLRPVIAEFAKDTIDNYFSALIKEKRKNLRK